MKAVVLYETAADITMDRIMEVYPRHAARVDEFAKKKNYRYWTVY